MLKVYLDNYLLNDQPLGLEDFELAFEREDGVGNSEQILREKTESELTFVGDGYRTIASARKTDYCQDISCTIVYECKDISATVFRGTIQQKNVTLDPNRCFAAVSPIKDNSFSALIRDYLSTDIGLYYTKSINCYDISTIEQTYTFSDDPADPTSYVYRRGFDVLDVLKYYVSYITDGTVNVVSDYLSFATLPGARFAITTGYNLHNSTGSLVQTHPLLSFETVFNELRKKVHLYMGIEYDTAGNPYLRIEPESYFYSSTNVLTIDAIPLGTTEKLDLSRLFNQIEVGSKDTDVTDGVVDYPQNPLTAWEEEKYTNCGGCPGDKDSKLDLVSDFIIDSNMIYEALNEAPANDFAHDSDIYLFNYYINAITEERIAVITNNPPYNKNIYNEFIINETVLNNWVGLGANCAAITRNAFNGFSVTVNGLQVAVYLVNAPTPGGFTQNNVSGNIIYDNQGNLVTAAIIGTNPYGVNFPNTPPPSDTTTYFVVPNNGNYNFKAKTTFYECTDPQNPPVSTNMDYVIKICVYQDNTFAVLLDEFETREIDVTLATTYVLEIITGMIPLVAGNCVLVKLMTDTDGLTLDDFVVAVCAAEPTFTLIDDDQSCDNITETNEIYPFLVSLNSSICYADWAAMIANKDGVVNLNSKDYPIKKATWQPENKSGTLVLLSKTSIYEACEDVVCESTECGTVELNSATYDNCMLNIFFTVQSNVACDSIQKIQVLLERSITEDIWEEVVITNNQFTVHEGFQQISISIFLPGSDTFNRVSIKAYCPFTFWSDYTNPEMVVFGASGGCGI